MELQNTLSVRRRRWWRHWVFKTFAISAIIIFAFYAIERQVGERVWNAYRKKAEAKGVKLSLADYETAPIPDEENYAAAPIFQELLAAGDVNAEIEKRLGLQPVRDGKRSDTGTKPLDLTIWQQGFINAGWISYTGSDAATDVLKGMERIESALSEVRRASSRPKCRWPVKWSDGAKVKIAHYGIPQASCAAFALRAKALLALNRPDEALSEIRHMIRADRSLADNPTMIAGLVRIALWNLILETCEQGIAADKWGDSELRALGEEAKAINMLSAWKFALESERGFGNDALNQLVTADRRSFVKLVSSVMSPGTKSSALSTFGWLVAPRGWLRHNQVLYNELLDGELEDIDASNERVADRFSRSESIVDRHSESEFASLYYALADMSYAPRGLGYQRAFESHSRIQHLRFLCAAARYRHVHGELPQALAELVPEFLEQVPHDIMDGKPMRYRRTNEGGCIVWSIGKNRIDDGGVRRNSGPNTNKNYDWIVELPPVAMGR
jgi:hypothetical protein